MYFMLRNHLQGMFRTAEVRSGQIKQSIEGHTAESKKLVERLAAAQEQYNAGLAKVKATNGQLQSLLSQARSHLAHDSFNPPR